jgi:hypothetical protein
MTHTAELTRLIQLRKVDVRCLECGAESAYTAMCYRCSSTELEVIPHGSPGWTHCLGGPGSAPDRVGTPRARGAKGRQTVTAP